MNKLILLTKWQSYSTIAHYTPSSTHTKPLIKIDVPKSSLRSSKYQSPKNQRKQDLPNLFTSPDSKTHNSHNSSTSSVQHSKASSASHILHKPPSSLPQTPHPHQPNGPLLPYMPPRPRYPPYPNMFRLRITVCTGPDPYGERPISQPSSAQVSGRPRGGTRSE